MDTIPTKADLAEGSAVSVPILAVRRSEILIAAFFLVLVFYSVLIPGAAGALRPSALALAIVAVVYGVMHFSFMLRPTHFWDYFRDWLALSWAIVSYRAMNWFAPAVPLRRWEDQWVQWDRLLLRDLRFGDLIEVAGPLLPALLEISYSLVYALPVFCVAVIYIRHRRAALDFFLCTYLAGLYFSYLQFPFWPSEPPWTVFPGDITPTWDSPFRAFNGWMLRGAGIHTSVFPSAHVSGSVASALAMWAIFPRRPLLRWSVVVYALLVTVATVYCRYHYAVDALAGVAVGVAAYAAVRGLMAVPRQDAG